MSDKENLNIENHTDNHHDNILNQLNQNKNKKNNEYKHKQMERKDKEDTSGFRKRKKDAFEIRFLYPLVVRGFVEKMAGIEKHGGGYKEVAFSKERGGRGSGRREGGGYGDGEDGEGGEGERGSEGGRDGRRRRRQGNEEDEGDEEDRGGRVEEGGGRGRERGREIERLREMDTSSGGGTCADVRAYLLYLFFYRNLDRKSVV